MKFDQEGGVDFLERLQKHPNKDVYEMAVSILKEYADGEEVNNPAELVNINGNNDQEAFKAFQNIGKKCFEI